MNKKKIIKITAVSILIIFAGIQLVPVESTNPPIESEIVAPANVMAILKRSCYDCHSNETVWPWYSKIAPISWLVAEDVHEGREELNFSTWNQYKASKQGAKIEEIWEEVEEDEMPLWYYVLLHQSAELSDGDREILQAWSKSSQIGAEQQEGK